MKILVTGANGFVGSSLIRELLESGHEIYALIRSEKHPSIKDKNIHWLQGDLLIPDNLPELPKIDKAFYLVHGLKEETDDFEYYESLAAINFINWVRPSAPGIIYLGGLGEGDEKDKLSPHLRSRQLTGLILGASGMPTIEFRASIVLGEGSLSFEMVKALSERIPFRPDFSLLNQLCQPIFLGDLLKYFEASLLLDNSGHQVFEIGGADQLSYGELLDLYAELANIKRKSVKVPEIDTKVIMKVMDYTIPELADVGKKLLQSLEFPTVVNNNEMKNVFPDIDPLPVRTAMDMTMAKSKTKYQQLWEKDFLKTLLSDKLLTQSGIFSPELLRNLEKFGKLKDMFTKKS